VFLAFGKLARVKQAGEMVGLQYYRGSVTVPMGVHSTRSFFVFVARRRRQSQRHICSLLETAHRIESI
jgi:hypothetical protein